MSNTGDQIVFNHEPEGYFLLVVPTSHLAAVCHAISSLAWDRGVSVCSMLKNGGGEPLPGTFNLQWRPADENEEWEFRKQMERLNAHEVRHGKRYAEK